MFSALFSSNVAFVSPAFTFVPPVFPRFSKQMRATAAGACPRARAIERGRQPVAARRVSVVAFQGELCLEVIHLPSKAALIYAYVRARP